MKFLVLNKKSHLEANLFLLCGDLYQLPPVNASPIHCNNYNNENIITTKTWNLFKISELNEIMRQKGDFTFISLLNNIRVGNVNSEIE